MLVLCPGKTAAVFKPAKDSILKVCCCFLNKQKGLAKKQYFTQRTWFFWLKYIETT